MPRCEEHKIKHKQRMITYRTDIRKKVIPFLLKDVKSLSELIELLNSDIDLYAKQRIKYSFLEFFIQQALEEQELQLNKDSKSVYRYKARFNIKPCDLPSIKGYDLLCKYGFYNRETNPNGVVKDHRYSIAEGYKNNIPPEILGKLSNCEFLRFKDNLVKSSNCSITLDLI